MEKDKRFEQLLKEWRHYLHQHPETAFEEKNTSDYVAEQLTNMGLEVHRNIGKTGIVANLKVGDGTGVIGLRADMDAISLAETGTPLYCSQNVGKMHGCGHDGHTATLLGAAKLLLEHRDFNGTVRFIFQPAEEPGLGAEAMLEDGLLERFPMDEIYGFHNSHFILHKTIKLILGIRSHFHPFSILILRRIFLQPTIHIFSHVGQITLRESTFSQNT